MIVFKKSLCVDLCVIVVVLMLIIGNMYEIYNKRA